MLFCPRSLMTLTKIFGESFFWKKATMKIKAKFFTSKSSMMFFNSREAGKLNFIYSNECENLQITLNRLKHCLLSFTQAYMREGERERGWGCYVYIRVQRIEFLHFQSLHRTASRQYEAKKKLRLKRKHIQFFM